VKLLLDTNVVSKIMSGNPLRYRTSANASRVAGNLHYTSAIVLHELLYGAAKSLKPEFSRDRVLVTLGGLSGILDFTAEDAEIAGLIRAQLAALGTPIGPYDVLIAAQALRNDATVVTNNRREFDRVPNLKVLDW
jgi:tRNA(fMet)-specific endonuclease VapC